MMLRAAVFDLNGVLVDSEELGMPFAVVSASKTALDRLTVQANPARIPPRGGIRR